MTEVRIRDQGGDAMTTVDFGEFRSSFYGNSLPQIVEIQRRLPELKFRDGDIMVASYPKAGCTWTHELVSMVMARQSEAAVHNKIESMLEATCLENLDSIPSPRLLNTHIPFSRIPSDYHNKKVRTILVVRNPKDTAVSFYNHMRGMYHYHYDGTFANWLPLFIRGELTTIPFFQYLNEWEAAVSTNPDRFLVIYYEDMKQDTLKEVRRIAKFLGADLKEDTMKAISFKCQFNEMKNRYERGKFGKVNFKEGAPGFFRKGTVGDWKNWFTVSQSELLDKVFQEEMSDSQLNFTYMP